jgi:hypothetical protein
VVRQALDLLLASGAGSASVDAPRRLNPPEEIMRLVPKYLGWANGDLRLERKKLFLELVAASFVCKKHYPLE